MADIVHITSVPNVPEPLGKYSNAVAAPPGGTLHVAGQIGFGPDGITEPLGDLATQTRLALKNIEQVLAEAGLTPQHLVKLTTFAVPGPLDGFYAARNEVYDEWFADENYPAHSMALVSALVDPRLLVEIEAVAHIPERS